MEFEEFLKELIAHNEKDGYYQIHLNSGNIEGQEKKNDDVEFSNQYYSSCFTLQNTNILTFGNLNRKPLGKNEEGTISVRSIIRFIKRKCQM